MAATVIYNSMCKNIRRELTTGRVDKNLIPLTDQQIIHSPLKTFVHATK